MKKLLLNIPITLLLASCTMGPHVSTNMDKENFTRYFSPAQVKIYKSESDITEKHQFISTVEGQDCQEKAHHALPDEVNARTQARLNAYDLQANGVVFSNCALLTKEDLDKLNQSNDAQQCHALVICYARAYVVEEK